MKKALVVDDTKNIRSLLTTCLELEGYSVYSASTAKEGLNLFELEKFDVAFIDIKMPKMSGTELFKIIREKSISTPVIIMTAFATVKNAIECTKLGAAAYLQKPFTPDRIRSILNETLINSKDKQSSFSVDNRDSDIFSVCTNLIESGKSKNAISILTTEFSSNPCDYRIYTALSKIFSNEKDTAKAIAFSKISDILKNLNEMLQ